MIRKIIKEFLYRTLFRNRFLAYKYYTNSDEGEKFQHLIEAVNYIRVTQQDLVVFEFGCHSGRTFSAIGSAARFFKMPTEHLYAFDSFEGLPYEPNSGVFKSGEFSTSEKVFRKIVKKRTGIQLSDKQIIRGFYSDSLQKALSLNLPSPSLVHIDVDLYSSTVEVLKFLETFSWKR